jgi:hypothetical protein
MRWENLLENSHSEDREGNGNEIYCRKGVLRMGYG